MRFHAIVKALNFSAFHSPSNCWAINTQVCTKGGGMGGRAGIHRRFANCIRHPVYYVRTDIIWSAEQTESVCTRASVYMYGSPYSLRTLTTVCEIRKWRGGTLFSYQSPLSGFLQPSK